MSPLVKHFVILFLFSQIDIITNKLSFASLLSRLSVYCLLLFFCSLAAFMLMEIKMSGMSAQNRTVF